MSLSSLGLTLDQAETGRAYTVVSVRSDLQERYERLADLGFLAGEPTVVLTRGQPGNEPLAVRIGLSTFALRRAEAACVLIQEAS